MAYTTKRFAVQFAKPHDELNLALRISAAYEIRSLFRKRIAGAVSAGVEKEVACEKLSFLLQAARKASALARNVPGSLLQWAGFVEFHRDTEGYPRPLDESIGTFNGSVLTPLPGNVVLADLGGIGLIGTSPDPINALDIAEVRVERVEDAATGNDAYFLIVVSGRPDSGPASHPLPVPQDGERLDA
jgi:hypothetical protein